MADINSIKPNYTLRVDGLIPFFEDGWPKFTYGDQETAAGFVEWARSNGRLEKYEVVPHPGRCQMVN